MNAEHARPTLAFCVLMAIAAVITGVGLRASQNPTEVTKRAGSPSAVSSGGSPDLVLGSVLRDRGTPAAGTWIATPWGSTRSDAGSVTLSADGPAAPAVTHTTVSAPNTVRTRTPVAGKAHTSPAVSSTPPGKGRGRGHGHSGSGTATLTATATATTSPTHGKGGGKGGGKGSGNGKGSGKGAGNGKGSGGDKAPADPGKGSGRR